MAMNFVRVHATLLTADGKSAVNTKLDRNSAAFKALVAKHSYIGETPLFGSRYDADYAPLTDRRGHLVGAIFVAVPK